MKHFINIPLFAGLATLCCLATLAPTASQQAAAQIVISVPRTTSSYYSGYAPRYSSAYQSGYTYNNYRYTGYGNGPYGYGAPAQYGYGSTMQYGYPSSTTFGYRNTPVQSSYYRGVRLRGDSYRPVYNPNAGRYYNPYGYQQF
jgi:hypothetical protein